MIGSLGSVPAHLWPLEVAGIDVLHLPSFVVEGDGLGTQACRRKRAVPPGGEPP